MSFGDDVQKQREKKEAERAEWVLGDYDNPPEGCPRCGRRRVCLCPNGKHRCEKCNWVIEDECYCAVDEF